MNKVKKFEISVVDRTYSKIVSNLVKFYSSDSSLEVIFILAEEGYEFDSAELVLSNNDGSLITRPLTKVPEGYSYEFEKDIISHHGEWKGQVILHSDNDTYVSSKILITIEDDLLSERPPKLTDVYSWTSLKRYADNLVDELKQAVLSIEGIEDTFNENETERQNQFEAAEQSRQTTFETNEDIRQTQELEREEAEGTRQTVFDDNEASRFETFNNNEATRQENETVRQQAESQRQSTFETNETERQNTFETAEQERQSAEIIRVENENQRNITSVDEFIKLQDSIGGRNYASENFSLYNTEGVYGYRKIAEMGENVTIKLVDRNPNIVLPRDAGIALTANGFNVDGGVSWVNQKQREKTHNNLPFFSFYPKRADALKTIMERYYIKVEKSPIATPYTKAPEDYEVVSKEDYYNHIKLINEFKDNQYNQLKQAVIALGGTI